MRKFHAKQENYGTFSSGITNATKRDLVPLCKLSGGPSGIASIAIIKCSIKTWSTRFPLVACPLVEVQASDEVACQVPVVSYLEEEDLAQADLVDWRYDWVALVVAWATHGRQRMRPT